MNCSNCGSTLYEGAAFCTQCGTPVVQNDVPSETAVTKPAEKAHEAADAKKAAKTKKPKKKREKKPNQLRILSLFAKRKKEEDAVAATDEVTVEYAAPNEKNPWKRLSQRTKKIALICAGAFLLLCAVLVVVLVLVDCSQRYEAAIALMDDENFEQAMHEFEDLNRYKESESYALQSQYAYSEQLMADGKYSRAKQEFLELADYDDAADRAQECQNTMDYLAAEELLVGESYSEAKEGFIALGDFSDAHERAQECQDNIDYYDTIDKMKAQQNEEALEVFLRLGYFKNSTANAQECQNRIDYDEASELMAAGDFEGAREIFTALQTFKDSYTLADECQDNIDYAEAEQALADGLNYTAYTIFDTLDSFSDATARAQECILETPETKEMYRNADYSSTRVPITFYAPEGDDVDYYTLIKIYAENGDLVSTIFLRPNEKYRVKLPAGKYMIKEAVGYDWFGDEEMFGDLAYYSVMMFEEGEIIQLKSNWRYTIRCDVENGNVGGRREAPEDF